MEVNEILFFITWSSMRVNSIERTPAMAGNDPEFCQCNGSAFERW